MDNLLRWIQGEPPALVEVLKTMRERAAKFNVDRIKQEDLWRPSVACLMSASEAKTLLEFFATEGADVG